ncbi:MAG TPA: phosphate/phosphite/phosphonate ABC transporter substrate-binding protein [Nitrospirae bacterium]|nr:phosphate-import protein PhnD precursor [bacterium BMS3Abin09]GBE41614.1 phosphate-import protein PhnD precursor [bacterium BMS3Bbin09]HDH34885.1 phosphate/phosphite/phosphonate ABC transporter substrate-binding protein [Nitrospirota bacterium]HDN95009.1 phosphate/phosphite/phosphonate ABC transporter substrate-binding protein [Nitrospirota bacterium]HDO66730.1 phosphate/phosphite/phosphonate ABC transporter substrate-binding protein [Nitrospirota bacterium]
MKTGCYRSGINKFSAVLLSFIFLLLITGTTYATELTIGIIPEHNVFEQIKKYNLIGEYIKGKTGISIKFSFLSKYGNIIESFEAENLDGAFWGSFTGAMAIRKLNIELIARPVKQYQGYIFVHKYSIIKDPSDMEGMVIAFVDKATTSGYLFPMAYLNKAGIRDIDKFFKKSYFTGSHQEAIYAVLEREANIGCANNITFDSLAAEDPRVNDELVVIAKSPDLPNNGLGLRKEMPFAIKEQLKRVLLEMDRDPNGIKVLKEFGAERFIETSENDYAPVFDIAGEAGIDLKNYEYTYK